MNLDYFEDLERAASRTRIFSSHGEEFKIIATDPYGLYHIERASKKNLPDALKGNYTDYKLAERDISKYQDQKHGEKKTIVSVSADGTKKRITPSELRKIQADYAKPSTSVEKPLTTEEKT